MFSEGVRRRTAIKKLRAVFRKAAVTMMPALFLFPSPNESDQVIDLFRGKLSHAAEAFQGRRYRGLPAPLSDGFSAKGITRYPEEGLVVEGCGTGHSELRDLSPTARDAWATSGFSLELGTHSKTLPTNKNLRERKTPHVIPVEVG